jgi:hypothetical protein
MSIMKDYWLPVDEDEWLDANTLGKLKLHLRCICLLLAWELHGRRRA